MPTVIITGGTGLVGTALTKVLTNEGYKVIIFSRSPKKESTEIISYARWNTETGEIDTTAIAKADFIINLAGAGVMDKKWTAEYKNEIVSSRVKSSELLIQGLRQTDHHIKAIVNASAIGWYGEDKPGNRVAFVETDPPAKNFLGETCMKWEESIQPVVDMNIRLVKLRFGIILDNNGGAFPEFKKTLPFGIASILGSGKQVVSWIHIDDVCRMMLYALRNANLAGVYNTVAPEPVSNKEIIIETARALRSNYFVPVHVPKFVLKAILGEQSFEVLKSTTVSCKKIKAEGFTFLYPTLKLALEDLCKK
ncbi:TIGR01777 family oxidoreductase [soil metagenome]